MWFAAIITNVADRGHLVAITTHMACGHIHYFLTSTGNPGRRAEKDSS